MAVIFDGNTVKGLVEALPELLNPANFLIQYLVNRRESFATLEVDLTRVTGKRRIVPYSEYDEPGPLLEKMAYNIDSVRPGLLKPKKKFTALDLAKRLPSEGQTFMGASREQAKATLLAREMVELDNAIMRNEILQINEAIWTDQVVFRDEKGEQKRALEFGRDSTLKTAAVSTLWSDSSANPLADINAMSRAQQQKSGFRGEFVFFGSDAIDSALKNTVVKNQLDKFASRRGELAFEFAEATGATFHGIVDGREWWSLDEWWYDPKTATEKALFPAKSILTGNRRAGVTLLYGAIDRADTPVAGPRVLTTHMKDDPNAEFMQLHSAPLAATLNPNAFCVRSVLS